MSKNDGKRKDRKAVIEKYLGGLFARTEGYARNVSRYYTAAVEALLDLAATADMKPDEVFHFSDHKRMSVKATNILRGLYSAVYQEIRRGVRAEWEYANLSADAMITSLFGKGVMEDNHFARWFARNQEAMDSFFSRKDAHGGLNLSQKVWKYTGQFKEEMELALSASLGQGDSASTVSRHVRQYLREPDRLFRRVRDAQGNLKLSKRAAAYHPGRGEYRSSYKNAMRLTRTETNMAYRAADCDRWSRIPFVVGMEVKRSNHPFGCEVCEALKGKYPKDFVFTGWHPQCRCYIVPVLASEEERMAYHRAVLRGEDVSDFHFSGEVREVPDGMKKWVKDNEERIAKAKSMPYFLKDNPKYVVMKPASQPEAVKDIHDQRDTASAELRAILRGEPPHIETYQRVGEHVYVSDLNQEAERAGNIRMALFLAENTGDNVYVLPHIQPKSPNAERLRREYFPEGVKEDKNPDLFFRKRFVDEKSMNPEDVSDAKKTKRKIQFRLKEAFEQADDAFVEIPTIIPKDWVEGAINGKLKSSTHYHVVYVKYGDEFMMFESINKPASH